MLFMLCAVAVLAALAFAVIVWITSADHDVVLSTDQLKIESHYLDENGSSQEFPQLVNGTSPSEAKVYLSVVVPAYNERERLPGMLDDAISTLDRRLAENQSRTWEIIIVDDGSRDKIEEVVAPYVKKASSGRVRLMHLAVNQGKGAAVRKGVLAARGEFIYMADADLAATAAELTKLEAGLTGAAATDYRVAIGSRAHLKDDAVAKRKWYRTILMHGFHALVYFVGGVRGIKDTQCGYKLFTRNAAAAIFSSIHVRRWAFDVEVIRVAQQLQIPIAEVSINWHDVDGSKMDLKGMITMARDMFRMRLMYFTGRWKVHPLNP